MANIQAKYNKDGKLISYRIRVFRGRDEKGKQLKPLKKGHETLRQIMSAIAKKARSLITGRHSAVMQSMFSMKKKERVFSKGVHSLDTGT